MSVLHDIAGKRVLDVVPDRTREAADTLWAPVPEAQCEGIKACAMDRWENYREFTRAAAPQSLIVHDKFRCAKELKKAVDLVRRKECRDLRVQEQETLTKAKYLWLKNPRNFTERQRNHFAALQVDTLKVGAPQRSRIPSVSSGTISTRDPPKKFLDREYFWAPHSRLPPIIEAARILKRPLPGLLAYTKHRLTNAVAESTNGRIQLIKENARGYRSFTQYRFAILFHCGALDFRGLCTMIVQPLTHTNVGRT